MDSNDPFTIECSFKKRLFRKIPVPKSQRLVALKSFVANFLEKFVSAVTPMSFEEWLDSTSYNEERKKQLRDVHAALRGGRPTKKQASHIDSFVKSEFYLEYKHARMINSRSDAFKVWSGPMFKAIEDEVYRIKNFIKHVPVPERPTVISGLKQAGTRYYQTDFTAFESHFLPEIMECLELQLYRHCLRNVEGADFLCSTISGLNQMRTRSGIRASCFGKRMSGDMCTSLGNGFSNLMLAKFLAYEQGFELDGFVEGDDGLFATKATLSAQMYEDLGFTIKIDEIIDPCKGSFCGMIFSESGDIVRNPRKFLMGFGWTSSLINAGPKIMSQLLRAKALSTVYETPNCPIVSVLAREALRLTTGVVPRFVNDGYHVPHDTINLPGFAPSDSTRLLFEEEYGIAISVQLEVERLILNGELSKIAELIPPSDDQLHYSTRYLEIT